MVKEFEHLGILTDEISDENIDFKKLQELESNEEAEDGEDVLKSVEDPKVQESLLSVNSDDSVKIYLRQIGKIPLLSASEEEKRITYEKEKCETLLSEINEELKSARDARKQGIQDLAPHYTGLG